MGEYGIFYWLSAYGKRAETLEGEQHVNIPVPDGSTPDECTVNWDCCTVLRFCGVGNKVISQIGRVEASC